ncbi:hypothetical protein MP228_010206 [Amoeboaphelidium protococcarum]|nr:hypothetical protein MP228_010206 [Amoeboaphelidium protococcarum]
MNSEVDNFILNLGNIDFQLSSTDKLSHAENRDQRLTQDQKYAEDTRNDRAAIASDGNTVEKGPKNLDIFVQKQMFNRTTTVHADLGTQQAKRVYSRKLPPLNPPKQIKGKRAFIRYDWEEEYVEHHLLRRMKQERSSARVVAMMENEYVQPRSSVVASRQHVQKSKQVIYQNVENSENSATVQNMQFQSTRQDSSCFNARQPLRSPEDALQFLLM